MGNRRPLTTAELELIHDGKLNGESLGDLAQMCHCTRSCARKWWHIGREWGRDALRRQRQSLASGALSHFEPIVAQRALYCKRQHPKRGASRILDDMEHDLLLVGVCLPKKSALAAFFHETCPELLQRREPRPKPPVLAE